MSLKPRNKVSPTFNMSSLADIIFLLLIFFLLTSRLVTPSAIKVKRPSTSETTTATPTTRISIDEQLRYFVDNEPVALGSLRGIVAAKVAGKDKAVVILDMDRSLSIQTLADVYDATRGLKIDLVLAGDPRSSGE